MYTAPVVFVRSLIAIIATDL